MDFPKFADLMEKIGFQDDEPIAAIFRLHRNDLENPVFRNGCSKVAGCYQITSIWSQGGEIAFFAKESRSGTRLFPFHKEEVDFLAKKKKFKKNMKAKMVLHHDDPPCTARLTNGFCNECGLIPDMQSTCFYFYCPSCDVTLKNLQCPKCRKTFERPNQ